MADTYTVTGHWSDGENYTDRRQSADDVVRIVKFCLGGECKGFTIEREEPVSLLEAIERVDEFLQEYPGYLAAIQSSKSRLDLFKGDVEALLEYAKFSTTEDE